jgi:DNA-binding winged helix-turn-helix (wHTH) protein
MTATRIDLGLAGLVRLGRLTLNPPVRTIRHDDGADEVVEPRVMQVLLALAEANGEIVRREELTERCWEGRIVGEDAINRVLSRLRRVAEGIGADSFRIETITRIGYRLVALTDDNAATVPEAVAAPPPVETDRITPSPTEPLTTRRSVVRGAVGLGVGAIAGGCAWWALHRPHLTRAARVAMERGMNAMRLQAPDQMTTAVAAFHEATEIAPGAAEPWGCLALAYRWLCFWSHGQEAELDAERARDAANKALQIDPDNGDAQAALATLQPEYRNWLAYDAACRPIIARHPDQFGIGLLYIDLMSNVGRIRTVNAIAQRLMARDTGWPSVHADLILSNWCLGRLDDADAALDRAAQLWPRDLTLWFIRQRVLAYSGRAAASLAMVEDVDHRPIGLPAWDFDLARLETQALMTRARGYRRGGSGISGADTHIRRRDEQCRPVLRRRRAAGRCLRPVRRALFRPRLLRGGPLLHRRAGHLYRAPQPEDLVFLAAVHGRAARRRAHGGDHARRRAERLLAQVRHGAGLPDCGVHARLRGGGRDVASAASYASPSVSSSSSSCPNCSGIEPSIPMQASSNAIFDG